MGKRKKISGIRYTHSEVMSTTASSNYDTEKKFLLNQSPGSLQFEICYLSFLPLKIDSNEVYIDHSGHSYSKQSIYKYLISNDKNPYDGSPFSYDNLVKLEFNFNEKHELIDPVTSELITNRSKIVANWKNGVVYDYQTIQTFNKQSNFWKDLVTNIDFSESDLVTIHDSSRVISFPHEPFVSFAKEVKETEAQRNARLLLGTFEAEYTAPKEDNEWPLAKQTPQSLIRATEIAAKPPKEKSIVTIKTNIGDIACELDSDSAPLGTINFLGHCLRGTYKNSTVTKIDQGKMMEINANSPSDESVWGSPIAYERNEQRRGKRFQLFFINRGNPHMKITNTSVFGISKEPLPVDQYHVIGSVIRGEGYVSAIIDSQVYPNGKPVNNFSINNISVDVNPFPVS